ncbi:ABC transporter permease [Aureimonas pseudogalii]|uniref:Peptide/nickel transport system permease protein n=1 Tax=Aureimonas pseudogalii TaxID=1744844 RepID=A0A7W6E8G7_9HYPH|nr:ABC transporter permease [Aureimonas pseudogalii]MBB3996696.1 peptide/nickel transport system permease protein [Aureimonas pseudogalii]
MSPPVLDEPARGPARAPTGGGLGVPRALSRGAGLVFSLAITLFGLLFVTFLIARVVPLDPVLAVVGDRSTQAQYDAAKIALGLDQPLPVQFVRYLGDVVTGNLGRSNLTSRPVVEDIAAAFPATLELATLATLIGVLLGVPVGVFGAVHQGRWPDQVIRVVGLLGYSMPVFWLGLIALLVFYGQLGWVGGPGRLDVSFELAYEFDVTPVTGSILIDSALSGAWDVFGNALTHLVLPALVLGYFSLAYISRMTRSFMLEQLSQDYVTAARVKGVSERRVVWVHALGNALVPLVTVIALSYAALLEGSVLTETVFAWPGLGLYITQALFAADFNAVLGGTLVIGAAFIVLNLLSDVVYTLVDPRAR